MKIRRIGTRNKSCPVINRVVLDNITDVDEADELCDMLNYQAHKFNVGCEFLVEINNENNI